MTPETLTDPARRSRCPPISPQRPPPPSLSVVIPAYNEERDIEKIVTAASQTLRARGGEWQVLVVDDGSTDATKARLQHLLSDPHVRLLENHRNRGKGFSVRRGMLAATGQLRLMCDADCGPSLASLARLEGLTSTADVVVGLRNAPDSDVARRQPLARRVASRGGNRLCRWLLSESLSDVGCGFKLFSAAVAEDVFSRAHTNGWAFDAEVLALARTLGYRVTGAGIAWVNRPESRLSITRVIVPALRDLLAARIHVTHATRVARRLGALDVAGSPRSLATG
ncbi:MAG: glycosyltransferase [Mycobacteriales bacterium]